MWRTAPTPTRGLVTTPGPGLVVKRGSSATPSPAATSASTTRLSRSCCTRSMLSPGEVLDRDQHRVERVALRHPDPLLVDDVLGSQLRPRGQAMPGRQRDVERLGREHHPAQRSNVASGVVGEGVADDDVVVDRPSRRSRPRRCRSRRARSGCRCPAAAPGAPAPAPRRRSGGPRWSPVPAARPATRRGRAGPGPVPRPRRRPRRRGSVPARVSRTPRPWASTSGTPASRSAERSCWDTADGVRYVAAATPVRVPRSASSRNSSRWRTSMKAA